MLRRHPKLSQYLCLHLEMALDLLDLGSCYRFSDVEAHHYTVVYDRYFYYLLLEILSVSGPHYHSSAEDLKSCKQGRINISFLMYNLPLNHLLLSTHMRLAHKKRLSRIIVTWFVSVAIVYYFR